MAAMQDYIRLKQGGSRSPAAESSELAWSMVLDSLVFAAEAEIRWLDHCEARLRRAAQEARSTPFAAARPALAHREEPVR